MEEEGDTITGQTTGRIIASIHSKSTSCINSSMTTAPRGHVHARPRKVQTVPFSPAAIHAALTDRLLHIHTTPLPPTPPDQGLVLLSAFARLQERVCLHPRKVRKMEEMSHWQSKQSAPQRQKGVQVETEPLTAG